MQNWKIKRMSYQELEAHSKAVGSLLYYYQQGEDYRQDSCPLCNVPEKYHQKSSTVCSYCLWKIIEREGCCDFSDREFDTNAANLTASKKWHKVRIPMLRRWKKILQAERDSRTEGGGK